MDDFAKRLKFALNGSGLTQRELARQTGVSAQAVTKWLGGGRPAMDKIKKIARALDVDSNWLAFDEETATPERPSGPVRALLSSHPALAAAAMAGTSSKKMDTIHALLMTTTSVGYSKRSGGRVLDTNEVFAAMVAKTPDEARGAHLSTLVPAVHARLLQKREKRALEERTELVHLDQLGGRLVLELTIPGDGCVHVLTADVTEQIQTLE